MNSNLLTGIAALVTFPGIILHEWSHKLICARLAVPVYKTCYFRLGNPAGYIVHAEVKSFGKVFSIAMAPFLICSGLAATTFGLAFILPSSTTLRLALYWLGISLAMHSLPSTQDVNNLYCHARQSCNRNIIALLALPAVWLIKLLRFHDSMWAGLLHAVIMLIATGLLLRGVKLLL